MSSRFKQIVLVLALALSLCTTAAWADYTFPNNTLVNEYFGSNPTNNWLEVIGDPNYFKIFGANLANNGGTYHLTFSTNWSPGYNGYAGISSVQTADLFLDTNHDGNWDAAIVLNSARSDFGKVYYNPAITTSFDIFKNTGYGFAGQYNQANPQVVPVLGMSTNLGTTSVTWGAGQVDIILSGITGFKPMDFAFLSASATCGNGVMYGSFDTGAASNQVPIPGSILLLGSGLVALGLLPGHRRRSPKAPW